MMRYPSSGRPSIWRAKANVRGFVPTISRFRWFRPFSLTQPSSDLSSRRLTTMSALLISQNAATNVDVTRPMRAAVDTSSSTSALTATGLQHVQDFLPP